MSHLTLAFLGSPVVTLDGRRVAFPTRKALALLVYLAVEGGTHAREKLAALFWPAQDRPEAQRALRTTLTRLRHVLQGRDVRHQATLYLRTDQHTVGFNGGSDVELDVQILQEAVHILDTGVGRADTAAQNLRLQRAVECYRGDFLDGFALPDAPAFDDWVAIQRERYHRLIGLVLDQLSHNQFESSQIAAAIDTARRWLAHDPLDEAAYRQLMRLHFATGDRAAALQVYAACRAILAAELAAEPVPETAALAAQLRASTPPAYDQQRHAGDSSPPPLVLELPLIGREREHARLVDAFGTVRRGQAGVVCIEGEAGIGKSTLALHFLGWAAAQGADVLRGQAFETGGQLPYQPLVQALRPRLDRENAPEDLLADVWLTELSRLLPELRDRYPDLPLPASDDPTARTRLFEALVRLCLAIAEHAPLVLFVDDVQWADAATLDLLHYAIRREGEAGAPILLVLALRAEALATNAALAAWHAAMERDGAPLRLGLGPLTLEDTLHLLQTLSPEQRAADQRGPAVEEFSRWLFAETSGQPLYMLETLKALAEQGILAAQADTGGQWQLDIASMRDPRSLRGLLPPRIREVVRTRLARLSRQATALLAAGAILGQGFSFGQLWRVANLEEDHALSALDELVRSQLLRRAEIRQRASADPIYAFSHDKIRDVVYTEAGDARRFVFHRRAFEILQAASTAPAILAYHAARAGLTEPAFHYGVAAGDAALRLFAVRDAIGFYEQARQELAESSENGMPEASIPAASWEQLYTQLGRAYELDNQFDKARETYQALLDLARSHGEPALEWAALNRLATVATLGSFDLEAARALLHEARQVAERSSDQAGLAETEWNLAQVSFYQIDWVAALAHGESALARARDLGLAELSARCLNIIAHANNGLQEWAAVEAAASEGQALYAALGNRALEADCLCNVAAARIYRGDTAAGVRAGRAARAISLEIDNAWGEVHSAAQLTQGLLDSGALREALEVAEHAVATARTHGMRMLPAVLAGLGTVERALQDLDAARAAHAEALRLAERTPGQVFVALAASELCADAALLGAWGEAHQYALRAAAARPHSLAYVGFTSWLESAALLRGGDRALAHELMQWLSQRARSYPRYQLAQLRCQALMARWEGRNTQVQENLLAASALAAQLELPCEQWPIQAALAELYQSSGDEVRARAAAAQAAATLHLLAAGLDDPRRQAGLLTMRSTIAGS